MHHHIAISNTGRGNDTEQAAQVRGLIASSICLRHLVDNVAQTPNQRRFNVTTLNQRCFTVDHCLLGRIHALTPYACAYSSVKYILIVIIIIKEKVKVIDMITGVP